MKQYGIRYKRNGKWHKPIQISFKSFSYESVQQAFIRVQERFKKNGIEADEWKIVWREVSEWQDA